MCIRVEFHQRKNGLSALLGLVEVVERLGGDFLVDRLHALLAQRAGAFDLLRAVRVRPAVDHSARLILFDQGGVFEVVLILELLLGVEVVERAEKLIKPVSGRQGRIERRQGGFCRTARSCSPAL